MYKHCVYVYIHDFIMFKHGQQVRTVQNGIIRSWMMALNTESTMRMTEYIYMTIELRRKADTVQLKQTIIHDE